MSCEKKFENMRGVHVRRLVEDVFNVARIVSL